MTAQAIIKALQETPAPTNTQVVFGGDVITLALSAATDDILDTAAAHGLAEGDVVRFVTLTGGTGLAVNTNYWVIAANLAAQTFQVSATKGGAAVNFTADATAGTLIKANLDTADLSGALAITPAGSDMLTEDGGVVELS